MSNPSEQDPAFPTITTALDTILTGLREGKMSKTITELYDGTYAQLATQFVSHPDDINPEAICHHIAGGAATVLLASRRIIALENELKAVKEMFNLP